MRKNRRIAALLTAGLLALTPCVSAGMMFASAADDNSISITPAIEGTHNYAAYQIFKGTLSGTGAVDNPDTTEVNEADPYVLSDIKWGDSIDSTAFLAALKGDAKFETGTPAKNIFEDADDAKEVAEILQSSVADKSDMANEFAKLAGKYLKKKTDSSKDIDPIKSDATPDATTKKYEIDKLPAVTISLTGKTLQSSKGLHVLVT